MIAAPDLSSAVWRKSRRSTNSGGNCVEVAPLPGVVAVRDSKDPEGPTLAVAEADWTAFLRTTRTGAFDLT